MIWPTVENEGYFMRMNGFYKNRLRIIVIVTRKFRITLPCWRELEAGEKDMSNMEGTTWIWFLPF